MGQERAGEIVLPLKETGRIKQGNALRLDWLEVCPPPEQASAVEEDLAGPTGRLALEAGDGVESETYICGNPPYKGATELKSEAKDDLGFALGHAYRKWRKLDQVSGWFYKASEYSKQSKSDTAFVATNSICQGEQVSIFWPNILAENSIFAGYESFKWSNSAVRNAVVTVTIVGISRAPSKRVFGADEISKGAVRYCLWVALGDLSVAKKYLLSGAGLPMSHVNAEKALNQQHVNPLRDTINSKK